MFAAKFKTVQTGIGVKTDREGLVALRRQPALFVRRQLHGRRQRRGQGRDRDTATKQPQTEPTHPARTALQHLTALHTRSPQTVKEPILKHIECQRIVAYADTLHVTCRFAAVAGILPSMDDTPPPTPQRWRCNVLRMN